MDENKRLFAGFVLVLRTLLHAAVVIAFFGMLVIMYGEQAKHTNLLEQIAQSVAPAQPNPQLSKEAQAFVKLYMLGGRR